MTTLTEYAASPPRSQPSPGGSAARPPFVRWNPVAITCLVSAFGLLIQAFGYWAGWHGGAFAHYTVPIFYVGLVVLVLPFCFLLCARQLTLRQRLAGSLAFALTLYLSYLLMSPLIATRFDETLHVSTLVDLLDHRAFFVPHSLLPVSPYYPGLELTTAGVHWLSGLPLMACQVLVVVAARTLLVLAFFGIVVRLSHSERAASIAVLLYAGSSQFWMFNAQFSYQTLALGLAVAVIYLIMVAIDSIGDWPVAPLIGAGCAMTCLLVTHHVTSWLTVGALWAWAGLCAAYRQGRATRIVTGSAAIATVLAVGWTLLVGRLLTTYLLPLFQNADQEVLALFRGHTERSVLGARPGGATPAWELLVMFLAMLAWSLLLVGPAWQMLRGRLLVSSTARWLVFLVAAAYPVSFLTRFSPSAAEVAERASTFLALAAAAMVAAWLVRRIDQWWRPLVALVALVIVVGGLMLGSGADWSRVTGAYLPSADQRSITHETLSVARWTQRYVPPGSRFAADITLSRLLPDYASVVPDTGIGGGSNVGPLFYDKTITPADRQMLIRDQVDFVYVDTRLAGRAAYEGVNFESGDPRAPAELTKEELGKFEHAPGFVRVLNGPIQVYDVRNLRLVPRNFTDSSATLVPGHDNPVQMGVAAAVVLALLLGLWMFTRRGTWALERLIAEDLVAVAIVVPGLMLIGAVGVAAGFAPVTGSVLLGLLAVTAVVLARRRLAWRWSSPGYTPVAFGRWPRRALLALVVLVYLVAIAVAIAGQWQGLLEPARAIPPLLRAGL